MKHSRKTPYVLIFATLLAALPIKALATDYVRNSNGVSFWTTSSAGWTPSGIPGATDRAIFTATSGGGMRPDDVDVGQLVWTGTPAGAIWVGIFLPSTPRLFIHGINGIGVDVQSNTNATLYNAIGIVGDQTWQATNSSGGGFTTAGVGTGGLVDLGSNTLTIDLVNAVNTGQLVKIAGTGNLIKTGLGTFTLTGANSGASTYTGSTTIDAGTLALTGNGAIATSSLVTVNNGATFDISGITPAGTSIRSLAGAGGVTLGGKTLTITAANDTFSGIISGAGELAISGGTQILSGTNTYMGGTTISGGTLSVSSDSNLGNLAGTLTFNGGTLQNTADFTSSRAVTVNAGGGTFQTDANLLLSDAIVGTGTLTKAGDGMLALTGDSSGFAGTTNIGAGTLSVNGSLCGDVNVLSASRLQGTGTVCDTTNAGTIAPGNSIGTLLVDGNYAGTGGLLEIEGVFNGTGSPADRLLITGNVSGTTLIELVNLGGTGAATGTGNSDGISIVQVGGTSSADAFQLKNGYAAIGPYQYNLTAFAIRRVQTRVSLIPSLPVRALACSGITAFNRPVRWCPRSARIKALQLAPLSSSGPRLKACTDAGMKFPSTGTS